MSLGQKIASNTVITIGGRIISSLLGFISLAVLARYLGREGFGEYHIIFIFLNMAAAVADLGLYSIMTREISKPGSNEKEIISKIFGLRIASIILFFLISFVVLSFLPYSFNVKVGAIIASLGFVLMSTNQLLMGIFQKYLRTIWPMIGDIATRGLQLVFVVWAVDAGVNFLFFPAISAISVFAGFLITFLSARKIVKFTVIFDWEFSKSALKISWPLAMSSILTLIYFKTDSFLLSLMKPASDVGIYGVAYKVFEGLLFFPAAFSGLILPLMSAAAMQEKEKFYKFFKKSFDFLIISALPIAVGGVILSKNIALLLGGEEFIMADLPIKILMPALFFVFLGNLLGNAVIALNKQKKMVYIYFIGVLISVSLNLIFIPKYSYLATSLVTLITEIVVNTALFYMVLKEIKRWPIDVRFIKAGVSSFVMAMVLIYLKSYDFNFFVLVLSGAAIYGVILFLIKGITKEEIRHLILRK